MRIVNSVLGDASGGRWRVVCDYSRVLAAHGHEVRLLVGRKQRDLSAVPAGVRVELIRNRGHYDFPAAWALGRRLRAFAPDIAIAHCSRSVALLKRALGGAAPVVAVSHSNKVRRLLPADAYLALTGYIRDALLSEEPVGFGTDLLRWWESGPFFRSSSSNSYGYSPQTIEKMASLSHHARDDRPNPTGSEGGRGHPAKPCFVVPNMVPLDARRGLSERRRRRPARIAALARFDRVKGLDLFIRALDELRRQGVQFIAVLGGAGPEEQELKRLAAELGLQQQLQFRGWVEDPMTFLAQVDLLCVPARSDAFGLTPLQGAAAGVPMVLSAATGHCAMFEAEREALFFATGDSLALARQMARLIGQPELAETLRAAAYDRVRRCYSVEVVTPQLLYAIEQINKKSVS